MSEYCEHAADKIQELLDEIELLQSHIKELADVAFDAEAAAVELRLQKERIEELEKTELVRGLSKLKDGKWITTDQIRAAWEFCKCFLGPARNNLFKLLSLLKIVRCEGCGGSGAKVNDVSYKETSSNTCRGCDGEGWVKDG